MNKKRLLIPIGFKLTAIVSLILSLSLGGLTLLSTFYYSIDIERTLKSNTLERSEMLSDKIGSDIEGIINAGKLIAAALEGGFVYSGTNESPVFELLSQNPTITAIHIASFSESGFESTATAGSPDINDIADFLATHTDDTKRVVAGERVLTGLKLPSRQAALVLLIPYQQLSANTLSSIIILELDAEPFITALSARGLYENYILSPEGILLVHSDRELSSGLISWATSPLAQDSMKGETDLKQLQFTDENGNIKIGSWKRFFNGNLVIASEVDRANALAGVFQLQRRNLLITVMILCVSMLLLFIFSKSLTNPIKRLVFGAEQIGQGDFSVSIKATTRDEIGRLSTTFNTMAKGLAEREKLKSTFGKFVNKEIAERLMAGEITLGGESKTAAIFFSDIRSFTSISEQLTPDEVVEFLNEYMTLMVSCVNKTLGIVDKFIGDAIMATWGVPYSHGNDTENAINSALLMRTVLAKFNENRGGEKKPIIRIGSGINTGEVIAGQIGSPDRMEYTCIGDAVNLASRIESLNKKFHTDILISEYSYSLVSPIFRVEPMKRIIVKGKAAPQQIYAVIGRYDDPSSFQTLDEVRSFIGVSSISVDMVNPDEEEEKYEVID